MEKTTGQPFDCLVPELPQRQLALDRNGTAVPERLDKALIPMINELLGADAKADSSVGRRFFPVFLGSIKMEAKGAAVNGEDVHSKEFRQKLRTLVHERVKEQVGPQQLNRDNSRGKPGPI